MELKLILQIAGVALGLLYLYLEYRANILLWLVGILMPTVHGILYLKSGLYADSLMQAYYVLAGIWGFAVWMRHRGVEKDGPAICRTPAKTWPLIGIVCAAAFFVLYLLLRFCTDSTVPIWDALTTAMSIVALWMLAHKYVEQWLVWCAVDAITVCLYFYKGIPLTACLYLLYTVLSVFGYRKWSICIRPNS